MPWIGTKRPLRLMVVCRIRVAYHIIYKCAVWREFADRIGVCGISSKQGSLTTTTAEIDFFLRTSPARLRHPIRSTESVEALRFAPDPSEMACSDVFETQIVNG